MRRALLAAVVIAGVLVVQGDDRGVGVRKNPPAPKPAGEEWIDNAHKKLLNSASAIQVKLATGAGKRLFRDGDLVRYDVTTNTPGYLYLIVFSEQNVATCIFPNEIDPENRVAAGKIRLPRNDAYSFPAREPFGKDLAVAILATQPIGLEAGRVDYTWDEIFARLHSPELAASVKREFGTRGVGVAPRNDWQAATVVIETRAR